MIMAAECRNLELTLVSASDLPDIRDFGFMKVYAKISLKVKESKKSTEKTKTPPDLQNGTNPRWNFPVEYTMSESSVQKPGFSILVELYCKRTFGDKKIGDVNIPIKGLYDNGLKSEYIMSHNVAGTADGKLNFLYSFSDKFLVPRKSSSSLGKALEVATDFAVLIGGALDLLKLNSGDTDRDGNGDDDYGKKKNNSGRDDFGEVVDGEVFYDMPADAD